jgi:hypothetical protein
MKIILTLNEALNRCDDWDKFCENKGYDVYAVKNGGGNIEVELSEDEAISQGIIKII